jgi:hypothetical protein
MSERASVTLQMRVADAATYFFRVIIELQDVLSTPSALFEVFANVLARILYPLPFHVYWQDDGDVLLQTRPANGRTANGSKWPPPGLILEDPATYGPFEIRGGRFVPDVPAALSFGRRSAGTFVHLALDAVPDDEGRLFLVSLEHWQLLYSSLEAVMHSQQGRREVWLVGRIRTIAQDPYASLLDRVRRVRAAIGDSSKGSLPVSVRRETAVWLLQELLGTGWPTDDLRARRASERGSNEDLAGDVRALYLRLRSPVSSGQQDPTLTVALDTLSSLLVEPVERRRPRVAR